MKRVWNSRQNISSAIGSKRRRAMYVFLILSIGITACGNQGTDEIATSEQRISSALPGRDERTTPDVTETAVGIDKNADSSQVGEPTSEQSSDKASESSTTESEDRSLVMVEEESANGNTDNERNVTSVKENVDQTRQERGDSVDGPSSQTVTKSSASSKSTSQSKSTKRESIGKTQEEKKPEESVVKAQESKANVTSERAPEEPVASSTENESVEKPIQSKPKESSQASTPKESSQPPKPKESSQPSTPKESSQPPKPKESSQPPKQSYWYAVKISATEYVFSVSSEAKAWAAKEYDKRLNDEPGNLMEQSGWFGYRGGVGIYQGQDCFVIEFY